MQLRFGHPEDKHAAAAFNARQRQRDRIAANVFGFFRRYVKPADWPTPGSLPCSYPRCLRRVPVGILDEVARRLQTVKGGDLCI